MTEKEEPVMRVELTTGCDDNSLCDSSNPIIAPVPIATKIPIILAFAPITHREIVLLECTEADVLHELGPDCDALIDRLTARAVRGGK